MTGERFSDFVNQKWLDHLFVEVGTFCWAESVLLSRKCSVEQKVFCWANFVLCFFLGEIQLHGLICQLYFSSEFKFEQVMEWVQLTVSWRRALSCRNQSIKSMDWFLYDNGVRRERVNSKAQQDLPISVIYTRRLLGPFQSTMMEIFTKIVNNSKPSVIFCKKLHHRCLTVS